MLITPSKPAISSDVAGQSGKIHFSFNSFVDVNGVSIEGKKCEQLNPQNGIIQ